MHDLFNTAHTKGGPWKLVMRHLKRLSNIFLQRMVSSLFAFHCTGETRKMSAKITTLISAFGLVVIFNITMKTVMWQNDGCCNVTTGRVNDYSLQSKCETRTSLALCNTSHGGRQYTKGCKLRLKRPQFYSQSQEDKALFVNYFNSPTICGGTYVEIGALDGIRYSNTKFFEDNLDWGGVLIEAQPDNAKRLLRNRSSAKNHIIPEAVCPDGQNYVNFTGSSAVGGIWDEMSDGHKEHFFARGKSLTVRVPCRPIGRMLTEAGIKAVDFFILDVEGAELMVLQTMDWSISVKVFVVEMGRGEKDKKVIDLLASKGYKKSLWNIRGFCLEGRDCANNQVFEYNAEHCNP